MGVAPYWHNSTICDLNVWSNTITVVQTQRSVSAMLQCCNCHNKCSYKRHNVTFQTLLVTHPLQDSDKSQWLFHGTQIKTKTRHDFLQKRKPQNLFLILQIYFHASATPYSMCPWRTSMENSRKLHDCCAFEIRLRLNWVEEDLLRRPKLTNKLQWRVAFLPARFPCLVFSNVFAGSKDVDG